jgi:crotonobetainyl-CoA:carnitine CoA-transferase CaiB-like acyl-CoA transferase
MLPASTLKTLTSLAALEAVGPQHRFTTEVVRSGNALTLVGGGDPLLERAPDPSAYPDRADLRTLARATARALRAEGPVGRLRLTYDDLAQVNPSIITLSVTGFGEGAPLGGEPGFDPVLQAMSGMMRAQGGPDGDPVFFTVPVNDVAAASAGALAVCLALLHRARSGVGVRTWTSLAGMSALLQSQALVRYDGRPPALVGSTDHPGPSDDDRYHRVAEGWVRVRGRGFDPSWSTMDRDAVVASLTTEGVPAAGALSARELADELVAADGLHHDTRPGRETWFTPGRHARFSRTERTGTLVAPSLGQHTREVLAEAGFTDDEVESLLSSGATVAASDA